MLNSRRAIIAAACLITLFLLVTRSHSADSTPKRGGLVTDPTKLAPKYEGVALNALGHKSRAVTQKPMVDMTHMSTSDKLGYTYPYDIESKFPAYIWQTWKYTPSDRQFVFREQEATWTDQHPGFVHEVVTDSVALSLLKLFYAGVPEVLEAYESLPMPVLKADLFRYLILFARGGIYSDIDTFAIQSADNWIPSNVPAESIGLVIGIEADPDREDWADWYSRRIQFCQWTIQSKPGHPVLREIISRITNATLTLKQSGKLHTFKDSDVVDLTGPAIWTDTIMDYFNDERYFNLDKSRGKVDFRNFTGMENRKRVGDVVVLPITSFSPGVGQMGAKEIDDDMAFVQHTFEGERLKI